MRRHVFVEINEEYKVESILVAWGDFSKIYEMSQEGHR